MCSQTQKARIAHQLYQVDDFNMNSARAQLLFLQVQFERCYHDVSGDDKCVRCVS